jgi:CHAD domain
VCQNFTSLQVIGGPAKQRSVNLRLILQTLFTLSILDSRAEPGNFLSGLDPEGVHEMRVALRRMRAALSDFREIIPAAQLAWMKRETKWLITSLGAGPRLGRFYFRAARSG